MKALALQGPGAAGLIDLAEPTPKPGEVLLRVRRVGLCGSDLNSYLGKNPMVSYPRVPGHEIAATIVDVAADVPERWREGLNVTLSPYTACGACPSCRAGRPNACRGNETMGVQRNGALTELVAVPHGKLFASAALTLDELALVEPFSVGFHAAARGRVSAQDTVLVMGCGGVGLGAIAGARSRGARVIAMDMDARKLELGRTVGATATLDATAADVREALMGMTGGDGPEVVIEAVGSVATYQKAVDWVAYCGRVVYIGYGKETVPYETKQFVAKELDILGSRNALAEFGDVIAFFERRTFDPGVVVSRTVDLAGVPSALSDWAHAPAATAKIMVQVS
jgi:threonine dehydrogenase-like Zn-dependent dehydrogenase